MGTLARAFFLCFLHLSANQAQQQNQPSPNQHQQLPHRKFEYKHSFKGPNLAQKDGTIPYWRMFGDAIASSEQLRLAPSIRSKQGLAYNVKPMVESEFWDVEMSFKVTGQGRIGADGLAMWYTANQGALGSVFGANDYWTGLGIFFDSFDNDAQRNNPYVMVMLNDGTRKYAHESDGSTQQLGGCQKDYRNKPYPVKVKVEYYRNVLTVLIHDGMTPNDRYELCVRAENVFLPKSGYFGLSAATGGLADDHDVVAFLVNSFNPIVVQPPAMQIPEPEKKKMDEEFERQQAEFAREKERFAKEHPDKVRKDDVDVAKLYEDAATRELRLIYEGQSLIHQTVAQLDARVSQILQGQGQQTALISQVAQNLQANAVQGSAGAAHPQAQQAQQVGGAPQIAIQRHETNEIIQLSRDIHSFTKDLKAYVSDIHAKTAALEQRLQQQGVPHVQQLGGNGNVEQQFLTIKGYLEGVKHDVEQMRGSQRQQQACPSLEGQCLSTSLFIVALIVQTVLLVMYWLLRGGHEKAKFY